MPWPSCWEPSRALKPLSEYLFFLVLPDCLLVARLVKQSLQVACALFLVNGGEDKLKQIDTVLVSIVRVRLMCSIGTGIEALASSTCTLLPILSKGTFGARAHSNTQAL